MRILLTTEGTYPFVNGGVSTWAHSLVTGLPHHDFVIAAVTANPHGRPAFSMPRNCELLPIPLWGFELAEEQIPLRQGLRRTARTTPRAIGTELLPALERLLDEILVAVSDPEAIGTALVDVARFAARYDLRRGMQDERAWAMMLERFTGNPLYVHTSMADAIDLARSLFHYLVPLAVPLPEVDLVHSSAAAFCMFPGLVAKFRSGIPLVLSEHGIYLRERILDLIRHDAHSLGKTMFSNLYRGIGNVAYRYADRIAPVCQYNCRWEHELGAEPSKVGVIYNGVDSGEFPPFSPSDFEPPQERPATTRPTIAYVGRVDPLKDVLTLIRAARLVHEQRPDVLIRIYGSDTDPSYGERCRQAVVASRLGGTVVFEGFTADPGAAYRGADIVVLSSMSEGFPFTVVEAMMAARPVVATAVGGVPEALGDPSLLANPQDAPSLAAALVSMLGRPRRDRERLGAQLRRRALSLFEREGFLRQYDQLYDATLRQHGSESRGEESHALVS